MVFSLNQILNVSPNLQIAIYLSLSYFFPIMLKSMSFPLSWGKIFLCSQLNFTAAYSLKSEKDWPVARPVELLNCEVTSLTVFTTMCPTDQQTSDNLILKDNRFIIEIFDFSFSGILRVCLRLCSHCTG